MTEPEPEPPEQDIASLAQRLTAYAVLAHDPAVPDIAADYWELREAHYRTVDSALAAFVAGTAGPLTAYEAVLAAPTAAAPQHVLREHLTALLAARPAERARLAAAVTEADRHIWIDHHLGARYGTTTPTVPATPTAPATLTAPPTPPARPHVRPEPAGVHVVIPFRDRESGLRTRNLLACLRALADQGAARPAHRVTVVETDSSARSRDLLEPLVDDYVFARKDGLFNKAWAVNVGVVTAAATDDARLLCVLDADILVDRFFVARNAERLRDGGHGTHLPFRWSLSLDEPSTLLAIGLRDGGSADVPDDLLRGMLLREPPGGCVWSTMEVYRVGGFDERYEGWGGEDDDLVARLTAATSLRRYDDALLHLNHPRPEMTTTAGQPFNAHIEPMSWTSDHGYGDPEKFTPARA
ncbi:glycosyltransferase family 2 protein [Streptomyces sp. 150FB]|uniref:glycosyltransferase family 2 protein n=1 Tax=Streptomyces sp. 150FB TaxID=1576605 RepID=UPI000698DB28|nr:glycosyltransferase family 2 protein [Streptomyces sp. 150FB]